MTEDASRATPRQRVVLMGTGPFAVPAFEAVRRDGHEIAAVVTRPLPPVRSRKAPPPAPVRSWAESHGLPIWAPDDINAPESVPHLESLDADLLVVCDYGQILKPEALGRRRWAGLTCTDRCCRLTGVRHRSSERCWRASVMPGLPSFT